MGRRVRLLWVTPNLPRPGISAARERWWALLARLTIRHDVTLLAFVDPEDVGAEADLPPGLAAVHQVVRTPWQPEDPLALLPRTVRWGFAHPALRAAVTARLAAERYDVVQYEYVEMGHVMPVPVLPTILTVHQIGFAAARAEWRASGRGARGAAIALYRYLRDLDFELRAAGRAHHVITMSPEDAARLRRFLPQLRVSVSPVGVDTRHFRPPATEEPAEADVVFVGNFEHPPNRDAARFLVTEVVPRVGRPVRVRIVGRNVTPDVATLAHPGSVEVTGAVADVRPFLARGRVLAAPVRFGTGMRGKVLEALAMERPVVTTALGAEGLGASPGLHLLVADGAADFAAAIRRLLEDPTDAARVGTAGRALVEARFDWDVIAAAHEDIYERVLASESALPATVDGAPSLERATARLGHPIRIAAGAALLALRGVRWHLGGGAARPSSGLRAAAREAAIAR
ncbi:MAG: glycosyltransferase [Deltaproteobacteria bacterium]|nr:MAG: glycosyltransferase [Deltaproteobacteria bacterium]